MLYPCIEYVENMLKSTSNPQVEFKGNAKYLLKKCIIYMLLNFPVEYIKVIEMTPKEWNYFEIFNFH